VVVGGAITSTMLSSMNRASDARSSTPALYRRMMQSSGARSASSFLSRCCDTIQSKIWLGVVLNGTPSEPEP